MITGMVTCTFCGEEVSRERATKVPDENGLMSAWVCDDCINDDGSWESEGV